MLIVNNGRSKTAKLIKKMILPTITSPECQRMLSFINFLMIFTVCDLSPLTSCINCNILRSCLQFYYHIRVRCHAIIPENLEQSEI